MTKPKVIQVIAHGSCYSNVTKPKIIKVPRYRAWIMLFKFDQTKNYPNLKFSRMDLVIQIWPHQKLSKFQVIAQGSCSSNMTKPKVILVPNYRAWTMLFKYDQIKSYPSSMLPGMYQVIQICQNRNLFKFQVIAHEFCY